MLQLHTNIQIYSQLHSDVVAPPVRGTRSEKKAILAYLPMCPFHASPSLPGPHSSMDSAKGKSRWACSPHCSRSCSLPHQPLSSTACPSLTAERPALVTLLPGHMTAKSSSPRGHRLACGPMTARGYLSGNDSPIFTGVQQCCPRPFFPALTPKLASPLTAPLALEEDEHALAQTQVRAGRTQRH